MTTLQTDLLEIYNSLVVFSKETLQKSTPRPIKVWYERISGSLVFEQLGTTVRSSLLSYYCLDLTGIEEPTYLLPEDYDNLMYNLREVINSGELLKDRTCLSPEDQGFIIFSVNLKEFWKGPDIKARARFISGNSWFFKMKTKFKYGNNL